MPSNRMELRRLVDLMVQPATFANIATAYRRKWDIALAVATADGRLIHPIQVHDSDTLISLRRLAIEEALRWGEPAVEPCSDGTIVWAIPIMHNARVLGGIIAAVAETRVFPDGTMSASIDIRNACTDLRRLAEEYNLTNASLLAAHRNESNRERLRAEAIHAFKAGASYDMRAAYLLDEPMLLAAIRKDDRGQARAILNRLLVAMIHRAGERMDLVKSFFMELVVMLCRTAVESGGEPEELLGANFASISALAQIKTDEELSAWLHDILERIMDSIRRHRKQSSPEMLSRALQFMSEHCCDDISRDQAADAAFMSPSHFSRFFKKHLGQSFTDVLNQMRIDRSVEMLTHDEKDLKIIALECGFTDQSYYTKVFRRFRGTTPAEFRKQYRAKAD